MPKSKATKTQKESENLEVNPAVADAEIKSEELKVEVEAPVRKKRVKNAFMFYSEHNRQRVKTTYSLTGVADVAKKLGEEWRTLPESDKQIYIDMQMKAKAEAESQ